MQRKAYHKNIITVNNNHRQRTNKTGTVINTHILSISNNDFDISCIKISQIYRKGQVNHHQKYHAFKFNNSVC